MLASANRKLFTGHEYDPNSGLYYAKTRYYDPDQGRFLMQDAYLGERWEQTVMFGRPSAPLLALSYDEGALGADVALAVAPFGGTGAVRSLGTVATGRVSSTVARTSRGQGARTVYTVDMGRSVGFVGGQAGAALGNPAASHVRLVLEGRNVITAFPVIP